MNLTMKMRSYFYAYRQGKKDDKHRKKREQHFSHSQPYELINQTTITRILFSDRQHVQTIPQALDSLSFCEYNFA